MRALSLGLFASVLLLLLFGGRIGIQASNTATVVGPTLFTEDVLHVKSTAKFLDPQGVEGEVRHGELWYDPISGNARYTETGVDGTYQVREIREGLNYTVYIPGGNTTETHVALDPNAPFLRQVGNELLGYKDMLEKGQIMSTSDTTIINGQKVVVVEGSVLTDDENVDFERAWISVDTGLPIQEVGYKSDAIGGLTVVETKNIVYPLIEQVSRDALPSGLFTMPTAEYRTVRAFKDVPWAQSFPEFRLHWLGPIFDTMPLDDILLDRRRDPSGISTSVHVNYTQYNVPGDYTSAVVQDLSVILEPIGANGPQYSDPGPEGAYAGEQVTVANRQARLYDDGSRILHLEMTVDGTFVILTGSTNRHTLLDAASKLVKLNPTVQVPKSPLPSPCDGIVC